ncbi:MAG: AAA family ATPase [Oceanospirillaceae bacterium]|nr:AAA family ATPase [Oceanospirillaceae bacterium]
MNIKKLVIDNFKCFKERFDLELNSGLNIIVGENEAGKSTILEAINLALTGLLNGRYLRSELNQYLFNDQSVKEYLNSLTTDSPIEPPSILIEIYIEGEGVELLEGNGNSSGTADKGISLSIEFDEKYTAEYNSLLASHEVKSLPIEYYTVNWKSFARDTITSRSIPLKASLIDSTSSRYQNGSDIYISRIVKELLTPEEVVSVSQAHRRMKETFMSEESIETINEKIMNAAKISDKEISLSVDLSSKNAWESSLVTYLDGIPFHYIGKGEQCIIKSNLALAHNKAQEANVVLVEEPENHLSHSKLNQLIRTLKGNGDDKQVIVTTHSSYVANKLGLSSLILLNDCNALRLNQLSRDTQAFFEKIPGYDTLRLLLCKRSILVEGDSDELIVQKAYMIENDGRLPIEDGIDVISVGLSFLRFLEIAEALNKPLCVVTDSDGDLNALEKKYENYIGDNVQDGILICYDEEIDEGDLEIGGKPFNYNTLEPKLVKANSLVKVSKIIGKQFDDIDALHKHMKSNKTDCALKFFDTEEDFIVPDYIMQAINNDQ